MVDNTQSPLLDNDFLDEALAGTENLAGALSSGSPLVEQLAVSQREGNNLTEDGIGADLKNMSYGELVAKYGEEVANQRINISKEMTDQRVVQNDSRNAGQILGDTLLGAGAGFVGTVGSLTSLGLTAAGSGNNIKDAAISGIFDEAAAAVDAKNQLLLETGLGVAEETKIWTDTLRSFQSDELQARQNLSQVQSQLDAQDSLDKYEADVASGDSEFIASLSRVGRDAINTGDRIISDGAILGDTVASALGSLGPSAKIASAGGKLAQGATQRFTRNEFAEKLARATGEIAPLSNAAKIAQAVGVSAGVGASEASGTFMDTANNIMARSHEQMMESPEYVAMIDAGIDPEQAKELVAASVGLEAFAYQFPIAMGITLASGAGRFNSSPVAAVRGNGVMDAFREVGKQTLEEGLQGASSQVNQNLAIQNRVDANQLLADGVGEQLATGAIAGAGMSGALAAPGQVADLASPAASLAAAATGSIIDGGSAAVRGAGAVINTVQEAKVNRDSRPTGDLGPVGNTVAGAVLGASQALDVIKSATAPVVSRIQDIAESSNLSVQVKNAANAKAVQIKAQEFVASSVDASAGVVKIARDAMASTVPAEFAESVPSGSTVVEAVAGMMQSFAQPNLNVSKMSESAILFAAENFQAIKAASADLPAEIKAGVSKIISSPDFQKVQNLVKKIDLNTSQTAETEVTPENVDNTVSVAKINPTNVNPDFVNKILEQPKGTVSDQDIVLLKAAAKIATAVNNHQGEQVRIINEQSVALSQKPAYQANPKRLEAETQKKIEKTSRSIQVAGFAGARSVNDFAADIFKGAQSPDGNFVNEDGVSVPVASVAQEFKMFAEHMANKTAALSKSAQEMDANGNGTPQAFRSLSLKGRKMVNPGEPGAAAAVTYRSGEKAVEFAQNVANDAAVTAEVYNTLVETFPDLFPEGAVEVPTLNTKVQSNESETSQEEEAQEASEDQSGVEETEGSQEVEQSEASTDADVEATNELAEGLDRGTPGEKQTLQLYHGTSARFDKFDAGKAGQNLDDASGIFFTNDFDLATQYSKFARGNAKDRHILEAAVTLNSPLEFNSADQETDQFWINNKDALSDLVSAGKHDGAIVRNNVGEITVVTLNTAGINILAQDARKGEPAEAPETTEQAEDTTAVESIEDVDASPEAEADADEETSTAQDILPDENQYEGLPELFNETFSSTGAPVTYNDATELFDMIENTEFARIGKALLRPLSVRMNKRLQTVRFNKAMTVAEAIADPETDVLSIRDYKNTLFVNPETMKYDEKLLGLASAAVIDWLSGARSADPAMLQETLEDLGVNFSDLNEGDVQSILYGVSTRQAAEVIAKSVMKVWALEGNQDSKMIDSRGAVESLVKELLTVSGEMGLVDILDIPYIKDGKAGKTQTINLRPLKKMHEAIGLEGQNSIQKLLAPEDLNAPSIGHKIGTTDQTQSRGNVPLSAKEKKALAAMQDTPHFISEGVTAFTMALGFPVLNNILGFRDASDLGEDHPLRASIAGKNLSIERDYADAMAVVEAIQAQNSDEAVPVYYPVGISKVGRHQFKGINPQNNKILRALVTPTHSTLDMTNQEDKDAFWLTVAQASDLRKVENEDHAVILSEIQQQFSDKFGAATEMVLDWMSSGEIDSNAFGEAMGTASMAELSAVVAVAQLQYAESTGTESEFQTTLSFELDGKTDGPANMMSNFGQGQVSEQDFTNFKRVGFFLGKVGATLNQFFTSEEGKNAGDLYEGTSRSALKDMMNRIAKAKPADKAGLLATANFSAAFGDLKLVDGQFEMTRTTAKSPMTKTVYGSGVRGVAAGIAQDMVLEFYEKMLTVPAGQKASEFLGYPTLNQDFKTLFGYDFPENIDWKTSFLEKTDVKRFEDIVTKGLGDVLSSTAKSIIGDKITGVNDALIFATGVQTEFLQMLFQRKLAELAEKRATEGKIRRAKNGNPIIAELNARDYNGLVRELRAYAPTYSNGTQTLAIGSFDNTVSDTEFSSNMEGKMRMKSNLPAPALAGVKVIPYLSIGRGDAMMMNTIYGAENAPTDTLPVFDGIDMPVNKVKVYADQINGAVMQNWDRDVLADVEGDFETFLNAASTDADLLAEAFAITKEKATKSSVTATDAQELLVAIKEMHRQNQARKAVFKRIAVSVDHMGGSDSSYTRGEAQVSREEINAMIEAELNGETVVEETPDTQDEGIDETSTMVVSDVDTFIKAMQREVKNKDLRGIVGRLRAQVPAGAKIVVGSLSEVTKYRAEMYGNDGQSLTDSNGMYDVENNVIFLLEDNIETAAHELVHMVTFGAVKAHYDGETNAAVERLEALMEEFIALDMSKESDTVRTAYNQAIRSIVTNQNTGTAMAKAVALNEFMAWTLSNEALIGKLKATQTKTLTQKVMALMTRLVKGAVPTDMWSNIVFNTLAVNDAPAQDNGQNDDNSDGEVTGTAHRFTNFWIDLVRERLEESKVATGEGKQAQLIDYVDTAKKLTRDLDFGGFNLSEYQKQTFMAIHSVLATEMRLDTNSMIAMNKLFDHVTANLSPEMFGDVNAESRFQTVMDMFGNTKNDEGVTDAIAVLLALSQTSNGFRSALDQLPTPDGGEIQDGSLNGFLEAVTATLMNKAIGSIDIADASAVDLLDALSESILRRDGEKEYYGLKTAMSSIKKANEITVGAMDKLAGRTAELNEDFKKSTKSDLAKLAVGSVALAGSFLSESRSKDALRGFKNGAHMGEINPALKFLTDFVTEVVGTDNINAAVVALLDKTNFAVSSARQAFREQVPAMLADAFNKAPSQDQWKTMHSVLGKTDFAALFDINNPDVSMRLMLSDSRLNKKIDQAEKAIAANFSTDATNAILEKTQQLANFMNGNGAGHQLWKNAYAINKMSGDYQAALTADIDQLVSLYAMQGMDSAARKEVVEIYNGDPEGVTNLIVYTQALNRQEEMKIEAGYVSEDARMNGYKGFIPDQGSGGAQLIIENDANEDALLKKGFVRVGSATAEADFSTISRGYYTTTVKQGGMYSQGVIQNAQTSYRGVDAQTGVTSNGTTSGTITGESVDVITDELNAAGLVNDPKEVLIPVFDSEGFIVAYERAMNPDMIADFKAPKSNLALMLGAWAGRQVEEQNARTYNEQLVVALKKIYDEREHGSDSLFVDLTNTDDRVLAESWSIIPQATKNFIEETFGEDGGFMVRKDMANLAVGYREASVTDMWSGKTRMPEGVQTLVKATTKMLMGDKALPWLANLEEGSQGVISAAKDIIVVKSMIVPFMNAQANAVQLLTRGVGVKEAIKGTREKLAEIEQYNDNVKAIIELKARMQLAGTDKNRVDILNQQKAAIIDQNKRMSIAPMIEAGAYKNISEGITDMDVEITSGRLADYIEKQVNRLPSKVATAAKYAMISKDTAIYRGANKAVQYGDFIAKAIYYDHLVSEGNSAEDAMKLVNEEFVNFSVLPGRTRSYLESMGGSWFLSFKIRIMKVALNTIQRNPVGALITGGLLDTGSPIEDNLISVVAEDRLDYSLGLDMLLGAPDLNPWVNLFSE